MQYNVNVIYEDNHLLVVEKPINVPVQEDNSKDKDMLTILKEYLKLNLINAHLHLCLRFLGINIIQNIFHFQ